MSQLHHRACTLCEATCGVVIEHEGEKVLSVRGDPDDPFSQGYLCPKAVGLQDVHHDPDRLRAPVKRVGSGWQQISWDEAYDLVAAGIARVQREHGRDAVAVYLGNPSVHSLGAMLFAPGFVKALRTRNRYSATSVDQLPHHVAAQEMFGHPLLLPIPDLDRTDFLLILGANPAVSNGSLMTAPGAARRLKAIRERGGRVVVIDPRRSETALLADQHLFIQPGSDALLLLALLQVLFAEKLVRPGRLAAFSDGLAEVERLAAPFTPARVAQACGIEASAIEALARSFAAARAPVCYGRIGVSTQEHGAVACWLINVLNAVTGRLDAEGGALFTRPAIDPVQGNFIRGTRGRWKSRVRGLPEFGGELPVAALAEEMETPGRGQVRALVTHAGNPVLSTPNGSRMDRAIAGLDFYAAIDLFVNETTRHAHVILPPTFALERDHYDLVFNLLAVRNVARWSKAMVERPAGARHDWEILNELTWRVATGGRAQRLKARALSAALGALGPRGLVDLGLRAGPYGSGFNLLGRGLTLARLEQHQHGLDLGPLAPSLPGRLRTADRHVHLAPPLLVADVTRLEARLARAPAAAPAAGERSQAPLQLIGRRDLRTCNSWMHNSERMVKGRRRCTLQMNPGDASARGLCDGAKVKVSSRTGSVEVELEVTAALMPGVVSLPHGWGHDRPGVQLRVATRNGAASINDLTDELLLDPLCGNASFSGVPVTVA